MSLSTHAVFYLLNKIVDLLCTSSRDDRSSCFVISAKEVMFSSLSVCLSVCLLATLRKNFRTDLHEIFREGWQWAVEQMITFLWRSGSPYVCSDCFPDSSLLGDTESGINWLHSATLQCRACSSRHRHSSYDIITSPAHDRQPRHGSHALAEVCTVPALLVLNLLSSIELAWKFGMLKAR